MKISNESINTNWKSYRSPVNVKVIRFKKLFFKIWGKSIEKEVLNSLWANHLKRSLGGDLEESDLMAVDFTPS